MIVEKIKDEFDKRAKKNKAYSLRAFAKSLDIDSSTLSALLNGKRNLTHKTAAKLLSSIKLSNIEKQQLLFSGLENTDSNQTRIMLKEAQLEIISSWEHYAILSLMESKYFQHTIKYICQKLNLSTIEAIKAVDNLIKAGLVKKTNNRFVLCQDQVLTTDDVPSVYLRKSHKEYIDKAQYSLEYHTVEERDITGTTLCIQKSKIPTAKKLIKEFRKSMTELLESGSKEDVYRLNIQLFPLKK